MRPRPPLSTRALRLACGVVLTWTPSLCRSPVCSIICCLVVDLLSPGRLVWWSVFLYVVAANAFFLVRDPPSLLWAVSRFAACLSNARSRASCKTSDSEPPLHATAQLRSLKYILLPDPAAQAFDVSPSPVATVTHGQRTTRVRFLVCIAVGQVALMGALVWV